MLSFHKIRTQKTTQKSDRFTPSHTNIASLILFKHPNNFIFALLWKMENTFFVLELTISKSERGKKQQKKKRMHSKYYLALTFASTITATISRCKWSKVQSAFFFHLFLKMYKNSPSISILWKILYSFFFIEEIDANHKITHEISVLKYVGVFRLNFEKQILEEKTKGNWHFEWMKNISNEKKIEEK